MDKSLRIWKSELILRNKINSLNNIFALCKVVDLNGYDKINDKLQIYIEDCLICLPLNLALPIKKYLNDSKINNPEVIYEDIKKIITKLKYSSKLNMSKLSLIDNSLDKAKGALLALIETGEPENQDYDTYILLKESFSDNFIIEIILSWNKSIHDHLAYTKETGLSNRITGNNYRFWFSRIEDEYINAISIYRFIETFQIGNFKEVEEEIEELLKLDDHDSFTLWLISRSITLPSKLNHIIEVSIKGSLTIFVVI